MEDTPELTAQDTEALICQFGLDILSEDMLCDVRGALRAAYCAGIEASEKTND